MVSIVLSVFSLIFVLTSQAQPAGQGAMNPAISANFLGEFERNTSHTNEGFKVQEAELQVQSDVDPYFTAVGILSLHPNSTNTGYEIEPEEAYFKTLFIPKLTLKAGKFFAQFGKQNTYHTHMFPFIDAPLISTELLGDAVNLPGVSSAYLVPLPWYSEVVYEALGNFRSVGHLKNLFDLDEDSTLEVGLSGMTQYSALGVDLSYKHRPTDRGQGRRFVVAGEYMYGTTIDQLPGGIGDGTLTRGFYTYAQYEILERTFVQYRFDDLISGTNTGAGASVPTNSKLRHGILVGYAPSEFSAFRVQLDTASDGVNARENRVILQTNITIGVHPAHEY